MINQSKFPTQAAPKTALHLSDNETRPPMMPPEIATATGASTKNLAPKHGLEALDLRENKSET